MFVEQNHCRKSNFTDETLILDGPIQKITVPRGIRPFGRFRDLPHCKRGEGYDPDHGRPETIYGNRLEIMA